MCIPVYSLAVHDAHDLVRRFAAVLNNRDADPLPFWLDEFSDSGLARERVLAPTDHHA
ncbi:hypothetical protein OG381_44870 [Streptomyces sp. NBC_00490]|uniref:hypothetical protein n=1 Tax=Streptomyces sp. NBC_00490 TaxID=2903657 RepID=UPI002E192AB1